MKASLSVCIQKRKNLKTQIGIIQRCITIELVILGSDIMIIGIFPSNDDATFLENGTFPILLQIY